MVRFIEPLPFELRALEAALSVATKLLLAETIAFETMSGPVVDRFAQRPSSKRIAEVRNLKVNPCSLTVPC